MLAQLQVINSLLKDHDYSFISDNNITEEFFPDLRSEFKFILNHYKQYEQLPDLVTFLKAFPNFEVIEVTESKSYLLSELYEEKNQDFLAKSFNKVKDLLLSGETDKAMEFTTKLSEKAGSSRPMEAVNILEDTSRYQNYLDKCNDFNKYYITTGFKELDDSLGGGIDRLNSYFIISARPGIGKTLIMVKFAAAAVAKGLRVGFYEGEMTVDKIAGRYDTLTSHISNGAITHGNISISNQYKRYLEELSSSTRGEFYILTRDMVAGDKVTVNVLENFIDKYDLDMLFIDQMSLLDSTYKSNKLFEQIADISKSIKNLQVRKHIPIVVASQQNRDAIEEGKFAGTENIAGADRISQDATEIIFLSKKDDLMTINIGKARDGAKVYQLKYSVDFDKGIFNYIREDGEESESDDYIRDYGSEEGDNVFC